jgi:hypothetical protein
VRLSTTFIIFDLQHVSHLELVGMLRADPELAAFHARLPTTIIQRLATHHAQYPLPMTPPPAFCCFGTRCISFLLLSQAWPCSG